MMGQRQHFAGAELRVERGMARMPRRRLQALCRCAVDAHARSRQRDAERLADPPAMLGPGIGLGMQAVVHVHARSPRARTAGRAARACSSTVESSPPLKPTHSGASGRSCEGMRTDSDVGTVAMR